MRDAQPIESACSFCGIALASGTACFRCAFKAGETDEDRAVHQRAMRRAVFELRATMTSTGSAAR